ncbi:MAG: YbbR-like domain-containing protein [Bacteroidota bacterium]|nr:YbbR-like domain-containing protein [Bacteroidota bacterium]
MAKTRFIQKITGKVEMAKHKMNKKLVVFLVFGGIATFFWFLRALEQNYITQINHPVVYINFPDDLVLIKELPKRISLEIEGEGNAILRHNWDIAKTPVRISFNQVYRDKLPQENNFLISVLTSHLKPTVETQLSNFKVLRIKPDSLSFHFSESSTKRVPVIADLKLDLEKQFMIRDRIMIQPDSVDISGPTAIIDTINSISTTDLKFKKLDHSVKRNLSLVNPHNLLTISAKRVAVEILVEQYTEKSLSVPIEGINVPDSVHLKTFPAHVQVTFRVVISAFDLIQTQDFRIAADYLEISSATLTKIKPRILMAPGLIENPRINPELVDYLLEQK